MTEKLWRLWKVANGNEVALTFTPAPFAETRRAMRAKALEIARRVGWRLFAQGNDFMIYRMPNGSDYELRIRAETEVYQAFEATQGYTVDEGVESVSDYTLADPDKTPVEGLFIDELTSELPEVAQHG